MIMQKPNTLRTLLALSLPFLLEAKESGFMLQNYALFIVMLDPWLVLLGTFIIIILTMVVALRVLFLC